MNKGIATSISDRVGAEIESCMGAKELLKSVNHGGSIVPHLHIYAVDPQVSLLISC